MQESSYTVSTFATSWSCNAQQKRILESFGKKGYTDAAVRMYVRCVGARITCAGVWKLALPYTAAVLFSDYRITYMGSYINSKNLQIYGSLYVRSSNVQQAEYQV